MPSAEERKLSSVDRCFRSGGKIDLGDVTCHIEHIGGSHTDDSSLLYVPERGVLFLGDCVYGRRYGGEYGYRLESLVPMRDRLKQFEASLYLVAHESPQSGEELFGFLDTLVRTGELVGEETDYVAAEERYRRKYGVTPDEEASELLGMFTGPNRGIHGDSDTK
jgi:glyoxylase-like metal-dependent hydrolase (beta-lactamase superfamily II)